MSIPSFELNNGTSIPMLGLGVYKAGEGEEVESAVRTALAQGYRLIDTASLYGNETGVGNAVRASGIPREEIFITTKVWNSDQGYARTLEAFEESMNRLQCDYVDLYLVHWPVKGKFTETWQAMEELYRSGRAKAIGVSNFKIHHLEELFASAKVKPVLNQVELHPQLQQPELRAFSKRHGILVQAWRPILQGKVNDIPELRALGEKYGKTGVQITLRWMIQEEIATIPKSTNPKRIAHNADIFDFELNKAELEMIAGLNLDQRVGPDPDHIDF